MREIELTKGYVAFVDDEDYERVIHPKWIAKVDKKTVYAYRFNFINKVRINEKLHRVILGITDRKIIVDHIDLNGLNNCKNNLRVCTHSQNHANCLKKDGKYTSKFKGVSWATREQRWHARVSVYKKVISFGYFKDELEAALAYNKAAVKYFGEFARINII